jgi:hypothetical protein
LPQATAGSILKLLTTLGRSPLGSEEVKRLSINYSDHSFVICLSAKKINVVKKSVGDVVA